MSMSKVEVLHKIVASGLVAVIRAENPEQAAHIADACALGGITALEITFTVPGAAGVIEHLSEEMFEGNFAGSRDGSRSGNRAHRDSRGSAICG